MIVFGAFGAGVVLVQTSVFLYESIAKLVSSYPARRGPGCEPRRNWVLHTSIGLGVGLQIATVFLPSLRRVLTLGELGGAQLVRAAAAVLVSWLAAELARLAIGRGAAGGLQVSRAALHLRRRRV